MCKMREPVIVASELSIGEGRRVAAEAPSCLASGVGRCGTRARGVCGWYNCTREAGHAGVHVAHVPDGSAAAMWVNRSEGVR